MSRPSWPFAVNTSSPEYTNLVAWCPYPQGSTSVLHDLVGGTDLTLVNGAGPVSTAAGTALDCNANDRGARVTAPSYIKGLDPITLVWIGTGAASPDPYSTFGPYVSYNDSDTNPYAMAGLGWSPDGTKLRAMFSNAFGSFRDFTSAANVTLDSAIHMVVLTLANGAQTLYLDGASAGTATETFDGGEYTSTSQWSVGTTATNLGRNSKTTCYDTRLYNSVWSSSDVSAAWNSGSPWGLYQAPAGAPVLYYAQQRQQAL